MSGFGLVFLPDPRGLRNRASQTMLRHFNGCERAGYLYQETRGLVQTQAMVRGSAGHGVLEAGTKLMIENDEPSIPPELLKVIVDEALVRWPVAIEEHDYMREFAYRWASQTTIDPEAVVAVEQLFVLRIAGWDIRCKIDFAELRNGGSQGHVEDYKTGMGAPAYDDIARKRSDGTIATKNFQLILYALCLVFGLPVRVEDCPECHGTGYLLEMDMTGLSGAEAESMLVEGQGLRAIGKMPPCAYCSHGRVETVEPFPVAPRAQEVIAEFVYPGIEIQSGEDKGKILRRTMGLTRLEMEEYLGSVEAIVKRLERAEQSGKWDPIVSDASCGECPCSARCPIPEDLRDHRGVINTMEELVEACTVYYRRKRELEADRREIKASAKALGGPSARVRFGKDRVWELGAAKSSTEIKDKEAFFAAVEAAVTEGVPFERSEFVKESTSTPFAERSLSEEELAEEAEQRQLEEATSE